MKKYVTGIFVALCLLTFFAFPVAKAFAADYTASAAACKKGDFFGLPAWYKYLKFDNSTDCNVLYTEKIVDTSGNVNDKFNLDIIWGILFAVSELLLMLAGMVAFAFVIVGAFKYVTTQGQPDKLAKATKTITNALVGAVIAIVASKVVGFIAGRWSSGGTAKTSYGLLTATATPETWHTIVSIGLTALGAVSVLSLMITGFQFLTSNGSPDKVAKARNGIYYSLIGLAVAILAAALINFIVGRLT